jgi:hypothetical protein
VLWIGREHPDKHRILKRSDSGACCDVNTSKFGHSVAQAVLPCIPETKSVPSSNLEENVLLRKTRRDFVKSTVGLAGGAALGLTNLQMVEGAASKSDPGVLFEGMAIAPGGSGVKTTTLRRVDDDHCLLFFADNTKHLVAKSTNDHGRTWSETFAVRETDGTHIRIAYGCPHLSLLHLKSGRLGLVHGGPATRPGRDGTMVFRTSDDNGKSWSKETAIDPIFAVCLNQAARVLSSGRIVVPVMKWISPYTGGESEDENNNLCFSWVYYSDDEGQTWYRSLSELLVMLDRGRGGYTHFEETSLEELTDGSLLMYGRTELGQPYQSTSKDQGVSWTNPKPVELASAYTPTLLMRIPSTKDLLVAWNQTSTEEIQAGLNRHRLSTAISKDEGKTWTHFRNLESLDDRVRIEPPHGKPKVHRMVPHAYLQPTDLKRYPHAPGCVRVCYPTPAFFEDEVTFVYDYGIGVDEFKGQYAAKVKIVSMDWLYDRV